MIFRKLLLVAIGSVCLAAGTAGIVLPVIPTVPFYLATCFCFARSSSRLHTWFTRSPLYRRYLLPFLKREGTPVKKKIIMAASVTLSIGASLFLMPPLLPARVSVISAWVCLMVYIVFILPVKKQCSGTGAAENGTQAEKEPHETECKRA